MLDWIVRGVVLLDSHELAIVFECRFLVCTKEVRVEEALPAYPNWLFSFSRGKDLAALTTTGSHRHPNMPSVLFVLLLLSWRKLEDADLAARQFAV